MPPLSAPAMAGIGILLLLTPLCLILAAMLERSGSIRLGHWAEEAGGPLEQLYRSPERFEAFRWMLTVVAEILTLGLFLALLTELRSLGVPAAAAWSFGIAAAVVIISEFFIRRLVGHDPEGVLRRLTRLYRAAAVLAAPVLLILAPVLPKAVFHRRDAEEPDEASEGEIEAFIAVGTREGILEPEEGQMVRGVMDFGDTRVRSIMTPRIDMVCAASDLSLDELAQVFVESNHSRIPIFERNIDNIVGILNLRDLVRGMRADPTPRIQRLIKPVVGVPETTSLNEVLQRLQRHRQQIALVVDEYGGTSGLVTVEDLLEEIVGEIVDEDDELPPVRQKLPDGGWRFDGRMRVEELEELFDLDLDDEPYDTVGGMIFSAFGHVPEAGEEIETMGLKFLVERVEERRIHNVQVIPVADPDEAVDEQEAIREEAPNLLADNRVHEEDPEDQSVSIPKDPKRKEHHG